MVIAIQTLLKELGSICAYWVIPEMGSIDWCAFMFMDY